MVLVPWDRDQPGVAARVAALGVAEVIARHDLTEQHLSAAIHRVLASPRYQENAARIAGRMQARDAVALARARIAIARCGITSSPAVQPPDSLDAWAAYQRGLWHLVKYTVEDNALAQRFFQSAIDFDPTFAGGYKGLCIAKNQAAADFGIHDLSTIWTAEGLARRAVALDAGDAEARAILSNSLRLRGDYGGALAEAERALVIAPNLARAHGAKGIALIFSGRAGDGLASLDTCIRLDPRDPTLAARMNQKTLGFYFCREYWSAIEMAQETIRFYPEHPLIYRWLAAALGQLGRVVEAKAALEKAIAIAPTSFEMYVRAPPPWYRLEDHAHMLEGLRKAGWEG
jgi:adenylate cyclase